MRVGERCAACLYDKQAHLSSDPAFLAEIREILGHRREQDTSPYLVYLFGKAYARRFGEGAPFREKKRQFNDLVLSMEESIRARIQAAEDPLAAAMVYARIGNYIDFGALKEVDRETFLSLFDRDGLSDLDRRSLSSFRRACAEGKDLLLITDNCGEIILDRLFLEEVKKEFPSLALTVMVRGGEVLNDATLEDAVYTGMDRCARVIDNGNAVAGTVYDMLSPEARLALDRADVILAKGQGNYESLAGEGRHIFYSFLCKCDLFTDRFEVPALTGMFVEEIPGRRTEGGLRL